MILIVWMDYSEAPTESVLIYLKDFVLIIAMTYCDSSFRNIDQTEYSRNMTR
jgi:hypothetical protein